MKAQISAPSLKRLIQATRGFIDRSDRHPVHKYIRLEFSREFSLVTAIAVDGYKISIEHATCSVDEDFTAYIKAVIPPARKNSVAFIELNDGVCSININGCIVGYQQPDDNFIDWKNALSDVDQKPVQYRIGFNGDYLLAALQAAKASVGNTFSKPIILEFRSSLDPLLIKTNQSDVKMVLPVRLKEESE